MTYQQAALLPPDNASYLAALAEARRLQSDQTACNNYLRQAFLAGQITIHDARTIWRGLYHVWQTPFVVGG